MHLPAINVALAAALLVTLSASARAQEPGWPPEKSKSSEFTGRKLDTFQHGIQMEWGYPAPQRDTFLVLDPPNAVPANVVLPDPPITIDYSAQNDGWSKGHEAFVEAMSGRKYPLFLYWGPFGHANNHETILKVNDLVNSFDWLAEHPEERVLSGVHECLDQRRAPVAGQDR